MAGTKVGPDQLGSNKKNKNKIKLDSDQLGPLKKINSDHKKKNKISRPHLPFTRHFVFFFFLTNSWLRKLILFLSILMTH